MFSCYTLFPGPPCDSVVPPYNVVLSMQYLMEQADMVTVIDNPCLYDICFRTLKLTSPTFRDLNLIAKECLARITLPLRFASQQGVNGDLRTTAQNLVPFPRLHFLSVGIAPVPCVRTFVKQSSTPELIANSTLLQPTSCYYSGSVLPRRSSNKYAGNLEGTCFGAALTVQDSDFCGSYPGPFHGINAEPAKWIPDNLKYNCFPTTLPSGGRLTSMLSNTTSIRLLFQTVEAQFSPMFRRKAFLHWYLGEGMEEWVCPIALLFD